MFKKYPFTVLYPPRILLQRIGCFFIAASIIVIHIFVGSVSTQANTPITLVQQGEVAYKSGDFPTAYKLWQRAETAYRQMQNGEGITGSQLNQAESLIGMGMYRRACKTLTLVVQISENICEDALPQRIRIRQTSLPMFLQATVLSTFGDVLRLLGNLEASQLALAQALDIAKPLKDIDRSPILMNMGNTLRDLGNRDRDRTDRLQSPSQAAMSCPNGLSTNLKASSYYQQAIACYKTSGQLSAQLNQLSLIVNISQWLHQKQQSDIAQLWQQQFNQTQLVQEIQQALQSKSNNYEGLNQRINFAHSLGLVNPAQLQQAQGLLNTVMTQTKIPAILANASGTLGWVYEQNQQWVESKRFTQQAISLTTNTLIDDTLYQWEWQLARVLQRQDHPDLGQSKAAYERAVAALEKTRGNIKVINPDAQFSLRDSVEPLYRELVDLSLRLPQPDLPQIISKIDALKLAELENFLACQLSDYRLVDKFAEDSSSAVFYPVVLADRLEVIVKAQNKFQRFTMPVARDRLEATVTNFRQNLTQPQYGWDSTSAVELYDWLIRPAQAYLTPQTKNLVFVLDGLLQNIPVAALYDRQKQQYLIDQFPVAVTPGLKILGAKLSRGDRGRILIGGLTSQNFITVESKGGINYEPLSFAATEVQSIKSLFPRSAILVGKDFTESNIRQVLANDNYSMIHLATHGQFSSDPHQTFVLTDAGKLIDLGGLRSILRQGQSPTIDLIVLSACETAAGDRRASLGLAGVALKSGAASTLASLWSVDDGATAELMQGFYEAWQGGMSKAQALRVAQQRVRRDHPHPYYWAAFMLVGNWL